MNFSLCKCKAFSQKWKSFIREHFPPFTWIPGCSTLADLKWRLLCKDRILEAFRQNHLVDGEWSRGANDHQQRLSGWVLDSMRICCYNLPCFSYRMLQSKEPQALGQGYLPSDPAVRHASYEWSRLRQAATNHHRLYDLHPCLKDNLTDHWSWQSS